ncbi:L-rhamnose/proton symporter RhaT [Terriglobus roseus]|uniref:L-rhamnose-H+ transport protein n=1 Tax=Terriglobus roseus TaxID=392734 RepID=A0A1G7GT36_9BACT|nr:L-rhamnose/proton symporter RhaT [Terriglobus roseus]SDE91338.1 L-rhamnose-H+ transport protein [Terriglobus roseus]
MQDAWHGGLLLVIAGVMNGSFALPMKRMPHWRWENIWFVWSVVALVVLPCVTALCYVPHVLSGLLEVPLSRLAVVALSGMAWGVAQVFFGLSVDAIGIALTFSLVLGISAAMGALVPFLSLHAALLSTRAGGYLFAGLAVLTLGMVLCGWAGVLRETALDQTSATKSFSRGLSLAILSGLCASAMNIGFSFSDELKGMATRHGASQPGSLIAIWLPLLLGGALPNILYSAFRLRRNRTADNFRTQGTGGYWLMTVIMAVLWFGSTILYGVASTMLGGLGAVLGWPAFMSIVVIMASFLGWFAGEWAGSGSRPLRTQIAGIIMLIVAVLLFSKAV